MGSPPPKGAAWLWLDQWCAAHGRFGVLSEGDRAATRYFMTRKLPKIGPMLELLRAVDRVTLNLDPDVI